MAKDQRGTGATALVNTSVTWYPTRIDTIESKVCSRCKVDKHKDDFPVVIYGIGQRGPQCKECIRFVSRRRAAKKRLEKKAATPPIVPVEEA